MSKDPETWSASPIWTRFLRNVELVAALSNSRGGLVDSSEDGYVLVAAALLVLAYELHGGSDG